MHLRSTVFEVHAVHVCLHQREAVTMLDSATTIEAATHDASEIKSFALVSNDNRYFAERLASTTYMHFYYSTFLIAVQNRVSQSFAEGQFNTRLLSQNTLRAFNQYHQAINEG
jgi:hypothetical protein